MFSAGFSAQFVRRVGAGLLAAALCGAAQAAEEAALSPLTLGDGAEMGTMALIAAGFAGLIAQRRRRYRRANGSAQR